MLSDVPVKFRTHVFKPFRLFDWAIELTVAVHSQHTPRIITWSAGSLPCFEQCANACCCFFVFCMCHQLCNFPFAEYPQVFIFLICSIKNMLEAWIQEVWVLRDCSTRKCPHDIKTFFLTMQLNVTLRFTGLSCKCMNCTADWSPC